MLSGSANSAPFLTAAKNMRRSSYMSRASESARLNSKSSMAIVPTNLSIWSEKRPCRICSSTRKVISRIACLVGKGEKSSTLGGTEASF